MIERMENLFIMMKLHSLSVKNKKQMLELEIRRKTKKNVQESHGSSMKQYERM